MLNFIYQIPMKIIFSKETIHDLSKEVRRYGKKVFMVYGGHSSFEMVFMRSSQGSLRIPGLFIRS